MPIEIGILALQGGVAEHVIAATKAAKALGIDCDVSEVRTNDDLQGLCALIIPGGESTTLQKLCEREGMMDGIRAVPAIFGTCAGAIMLAKKVSNRESDQRTLEVMDIEIDRNGYGRQIDSFESDLDCMLGRVRAVFIRAPRIKKIGSNVRALASLDGEAVACEQDGGDGRYYLATTFHPELATSKFHERFLSRLFPRQ